MTLFDVVTVCCFAGLVLAFFVFTDQSPKLLLGFLVAGVALAVANQVGNHGYAIVAAGLIAAAMTFAAMLVSS